MSGLTRRNFINLVGKAGGAAAAYNTMVVLGLLEVPSAYAGPPQLAPGSGRGQKIVILGAGLAGMTAAYELTKAGYECVILEARNRAGGRCWTLRGGDKIEETDSVQTVDWDRSENLFFNPGPARLPYHHKAVLGYCREFGVPLQVIVNDNRNAFLQDNASFGGKPVRMRQARQDIQGHLAELLAKSINKGTLDSEIDGMDKEKLLAFVRGYGPLDKDLAYRSSQRAGYAEPPGAGLQYGTLNEPLAMRTLLQNDFWNWTTTFFDDYDQAATMLQPVGGMDRIAAAFKKRVGSMIRYGAVVTQIRRTGERDARIIYKDQGKGQEKAIEASFVIVAIPPTVTKDIDSDFSLRHKTAIAGTATQYIPAAKAAFQARRRFWEEDEQIYGGVSWTSQDISQIWYPSSDFHGRGGIVVGAYIWSNEIAERFAKLAPAERISLAIAQGEKLHPTYRADVTKGVSVAWAKVPFNHGAFCIWHDEAKKRELYPVLVEPDGPFVFAGDYASNISSWQEGAVLSAHRAVKMIAEKVAVRKA